MNMKKSTTKTIVPKTIGTNKWMRKFLEDKPDYLPWAGWLQQKIEKEVEKAYKEGYEKAMSDTYAERL